MTLQIVSPRVPILTILCQYTVCDVDLVILYKKTLCMFICNMCNAPGVCESNKGIIDDVCCNYDDACKYNCMSKKNTGVHIPYRTVSYGKIIFHTVRYSHLPDYFSSMPSKF